MYSWLGAAPLRRGEKGTIVNASLLRREETASRPEQTQQEARQHAAPRHAEPNMLKVLN